MTTLLKNRFERIIEQKPVVIVAVVLMPIMIVIAILFSAPSTTNEVIGYLGANTDNLPISDQFDIEPITEMPTLSQHVTGAYAAIVSQDDAGNYIISTLRSDEDAAAIMTLFETGSLPANYKGEDVKREERGIGTNILGFIIMLVLIQAVALTGLYPKDRSLGMFRRIMSTPTNMRAYLLAQLTFTFTCLYIPTYIAIIFAKLCFNAELGYSLGMLAILLLILSLFATAFAFFISSILDRNLNLITSGIAIITSILAGCFVEIESGNKIVEIICKVLPQRSYLDMVHGIEFGGQVADYIGELLYLFAFALVFIIISVYLVKARTAKGVY